MVEALCSYWASMLVVWLSHANTASNPKSRYKWHVVSYMCFYLRWPCRRCYMALRLSNYPHTLSYTTFDTVYIGWIRKPTKNSRSHSPQPNGKVSKYHRCIYHKNRIGMWTLPGQQTRWASCHEKEEARELRSSCWWQRSQVRLACSLHSINAI